MDDDDPNDEHADGVTRPRWVIAVLFLQSTIIIEPHTNIILVNMMMAQHSGLFIIISSTSGE